VSLTLGAVDSYTHHGHTNIIDRGPRT
jgi:hypothetical protein